MRRPRSQGDYAKALLLHEDCLAQRRASLGANHPDTLSSMNNLATLYYSQGDYAKALIFYEEAMKAAEEKGYPKAKVFRSNYNACLSKM